MLTALGLTAQRRKSVGRPGLVPHKSTLRLGSESKECTRSSSRQALIRSASKTEEKPTDVRCFTEVMTVDSDGSTPLVLRWVESRQHTLGLSHPRVRVFRAFIYQLLCVHEFKVVPGSSTPGHFA